MKKISKEIFGADITSLGRRSGIVVADGKAPRNERGRLGSGDDWYERRGKVEIGFKNDRFCVYNKK